MFKFCLNRQIQEIEILKSIFCGDQELVVKNEEQFTRFKTKGISSSDGESDPFVLQFKLPIRGYKNSCSSKQAVCFNVTLPNFYPSTESVIVRAEVFPPALPPTHMKSWKAGLDNFLAQKMGRECIFDLAQWVVGWLESSLKPFTRCFTSADAGKQKQVVFRRSLIWFSTIAPDRTKAISQWAKDLELTGCCQPCSPAVLLLEGQKENVDQCIVSLRQTFRWRKMEVISEEDARVDSITASRKFDKFREYNSKAVNELHQIFCDAGLESIYRDALKIRG